MFKGNESNLVKLVSAQLGADAAAQAFEAVAIDPALVAETGPVVSRAVFSMAMAMLLFDGLIARVPSAAAYCSRRQRVAMDHGALRTIRFPQGPTGALPAGHLAFARILEPLGYRVAETYPLPRLRMTGHGYRHLDLPETVPQYFVSELHIDRFDCDFAAAAARVFGGSEDPLGPVAVELLDCFSRDGCVPEELAMAGIGGIVSAFDCQHPPCRIADYELLLAQSAEAAWIATEGNAFNHATDRVADVDALAATLRSEGWPIKDRVEVSASGRVWQTAFRADSVERSFIGPDGSKVLRTVPGCFYEFITRKIDPATGRLDLAFDSGNATGIFAMTKAA